ncbi:PaaI family thioesterase [Cohnella sp.]|uniref:PaaI family thioesterase n=1 Tax=Cohnella sp. TaxID=1883426 RepID=UPI003567DBAB
MDTTNGRSQMEHLSELARKTFWGYVGCELEYMDESKVIVSLEVQEHHLNLIGILHGGVHTTLLDSAMGIMAMSARLGEDVVTSNMNIHFTSPVRLGKVTVVAEILHKSGRMITTQGSLRNENDTLCSLATASFRVIEQNS